MNLVLQESAESQKPRGHLDQTGFDRHIEFHTYTPPADLAPFLEHFWTLEWDKTDSPYRSEQVMHRPYVDIFISDKWSGIQGTFRNARIYTAAGHGRIIGIRFLPGAFHCFWAGEMRVLQDQIVAIQDAFPTITTGLIQSLLRSDNQTVMQQLAKIICHKLPSPNPKVDFIQRVIAALDQALSLQTVSSVATSFGKSERWVQDVFREYVGIGLKWHMQRNKLLTAVSEIRNTTKPDWADIAYQAGYSSQQHFITDFKKVTGSTPQQYFLQTRA